MSKEEGGMGRETEGGGKKMGHDEKKINFGSLFSGACVCSLVHVWSRVTLHVLVSVHVYILAYRAGGFFVPIKLC